MFIKMFRISKHHLNLSRGKVIAERLQQQHQQQQ